MSDAATLPRAEAAVAPVIEAQDLVKTYEVGRGLFSPPGVVRAVSGISLTLAPRRTLAVVGESGSGKSTLGRMLALIEPPTGGHLAIDGVDVTGVDGARLKGLRRSVQMVFQNPYGSLNPRRTIRASLEEPLLVNTDLTPDQRHARAVDMLTRVGLRPEHAERYPHMFSGGQRQRIAIARALMLRPKIIVLDEPRHPYTKALLSATPVADPGRPRDRIVLTGELPSPFAPPPGCVFHPRCPVAIDRCRVEKPMLAGDGTRLTACHLAP